MGTGSVLPSPCPPSILGRASPPPSRPQPGSAPAASISSPGRTQTHDKSLLRNRTGDSTGGRGKTLTHTLLLLLLLHAVKAVRVILSHQQPAVLHYLDWISQRWCSRGPTWLLKWCTSCRTVWAVKWFDPRRGQIQSVLLMIRGSMKFAVAVLWFSLAVGKATMQGKTRETHSSLNCWCCTAAREHLICPKQQTVNWLRTQQHLNPGEDLGSCCAIKTRHPTALQPHLSNRLIGQRVQSYLQRRGKSFMRKWAHCIIQMGLHFKSCGGQQDKMTGSGERSTFMIY